MAVRFQDQDGVSYESTDAITWYGDIISLLITSSWNILKLGETYSMSWMLLNDWDESSSWVILNDISSDSSWHIIGDQDIQGSWHILTDQSSNSSWHILVDEEIQSSWNLQGITIFIPGIDIQANFIATYFKAYLKPELNIRAFRSDEFYHRTEKEYEFRALRKIKRK